MQINIGDQILAPFGGRYTVAGFRANGKIVTRESRQPDRCYSALEIMPDELARLVTTAVCRVIKKEVA